MAEIEVTPDMIKAGVEAAANWDSRFEPYESLPIEIYEAMERVRRGKCPITSVCLEGPMKVSFAHFPPKNIESYRDSLAMTKARRKVV
jgi:hypothetical protein